MVSVLQEYAAAHSHNGLHITVTASQPLPNLPAAAEVAAYRIPIEAITNVVRYAQAHHRLVHLKSIMVCNQKSAMMASA
ncbi:MAG: hypothetical protein IPL78_23130 [Chloroflexi bacterium]|nr:hypothetical protein [Chloroflexota bacterium]